MKFRTARLLKCVSQAKLAIMSGISEWTINRLERGLCHPSPTTIRLLSASLERDPQSIDEFKSSIASSTGGVNQ